MVDSNNIEVMRENIKELDQKISEAGSGLPDPSAATDGQLLTVDDGEWTIANPPEIDFVEFSLSSVDPVPETVRNEIWDCYSAGKVVFIRCVPYLYKLTDFTLIIDPPSLDTLTAVSLDSDGTVRKLTAGTSTEWIPVSSVVSKDINYSTTEQDTGKKWTDGRSIYQKAFPLTLTSGSDGKVAREDVSSLNIDQVINYSGYITDGTSTYPVIEWLSVTIYSYVHVAIIDSVKTLDLLSKIPNVTSAVVVLEYVKTPTTNTRSKKTTKKYEE